MRDLQKDEPDNRRNNGSAKRLGVKFDAVVGLKVLRKGRSIDK